MKWYYQRLFPVYASTDTETLRKPPMFYRSDHPKNTVVIDTDITVENTVEVREAIPERIETVSAHIAGTVNGHVVVFPFTCEILRVFHLFHTYVQILETDQGNSLVSFINRRYKKELETALRRFKELATVQGWKQRNIDQTVQQFATNAQGLQMLHTLIKALETVTS